MKSDQLDQIAPAFCKLQAALKPVQRDKTAHIRTKSGGEYSYKYADLGSVMVMLQQALSENGLSVNWFPTIEEKRITVETMLMHTSGQWMSCSLWWPLKFEDIKELGSVQTYLRRYGIEPLLGIVTEDERDEDRGLPEDLVSSYVEALVAAPDAAALKDEYRKAYSIASMAGDIQAMNRFTDAKDQRKVELGISDKPKGNGKTNEFLPKAKAQEKQQEPAPQSEPPGIPPCSPAQQRMIHDIAARHGVEGDTFTELFTREFAVPLHELHAVYFSDAMKWAKSLKRAS